MREFHLHPPTPVTRIRDILAILEALTTIYATVSDQIDGSLEYLFLEVLAILIMWYDGRDTS